MRKSIFMKSSGECFHPSFEKSMPINVASVSLRNARKNVGLPQPISSTLLAEFKVAYFFTTPMRALSVFCWSFCTNDPYFPHASDSR